MIIAMIILKFVSKYLSIGCVDYVCYSIFLPSVNRQYTKHRLREIIIEYLLVLIPIFLLFLDLALIIKFDTYRQFPIVFMLTFLFLIIDIMFSAIGYSIFLAKYLFKHNKLLAHFLVVTALLCQIILLIYGVLIVMMNL